jgi:anti-sigma factor RsiW
MLRARHLNDDRLFECYLAERSRELLDPPAAEHLADCDLCATRYAEFGRFMDVLREEGEAESDEVFTQERLRGQQQQIARRIEHVGRAARVISFPGQFVRRTITASTSRIAPRWIAAAAAAGLFVGIALGSAFEWDARLRPQRPTSSQITMAARPGAMRGNVVQDLAADDAFLTELEAALDRPRTRELVAFDAFTPHVREVPAVDAR